MDEVKRRSRDSRWRRPLNASSGSRKANPDQIPARDPAEWLLSGGASKAGDEHKTREPIRRRVSVRLVGELAVENRRFHLL